MHGDGWAGTVFILVGLFFKLSKPEQLKWMFGNSLQSRSDSRSMPPVLAMIY